MEDGTAAIVLQASPGPFVHCCSSVIQYMGPELPHCLRCVHIALHLFKDISPCLNDTSGLILSERGVAAVLLAQLLQCCSCVACPGDESKRWGGGVVLQDEQLRPLLEMYRQAGRKVFIATNSLWDYTNVVMNFLVDGKVGPERNTEWLRVRRSQDSFNLCIFTMPECTAACFWKCRLKPISWVPVLHIRKQDSKTHRLCSRCICCNFA